MNETVDTSAKWDRLEAAGLVRLVVEPDLDWDYDDLAGEMFNADCCPEIPADELAKQEADYKQRIDSEGVWGVVGEYKHPRLGWIAGDNAWGFVGDEYKDDCEDIKSQTMDELRGSLVTRCPACRH